MASCVGHACPPPPEEAAQDATFQRLQQGALPGAGVSEQLQLDSRLDGLSGSQLLDVAQFVVVLTPKTKRKDSLKTSDSSGHVELTRLSSVRHELPQLFISRSPKNPMTDFNLLQFVPLKPSTQCDFLSQTKNDWT